MGVFSKFKGLVNKNQEEHQCFLALNINQDSIEACIWGVIDGKTNLLGSASEKYKGFENLPFTTGQVIDSAGEKAKVDVTQTIFGLPEDWIDQDKVNEPYAHMLKKLAKELELEPLAFVSTPKAIAHLLFREEQTPINAIIVGVSEETITVSLLTNSKINTSKVTGRISDNVVDEITKAIDSIQPGQTIPSRIVLYGSVANLDKIHSQLSSQNWPVQENSAQSTEITQNVLANQRFLHPPKIEVLESGSQGKAVALAGATDLGFSQNPMFLSGPVQQSPLQNENTNQSNFGFVQGKDILAEDNPPHVPEEHSMSELNNQVPKPKGSLKFIIVPLTRFLKKLPLNFSARRNLFLIPVIAVVLIFIILFALYWFVPKAKVELYVRAKPLVQEAQITASPQLTAIDEQKGQIPAQVDETTQKGSQKAVATGKKLIGDKATGKVTVFNKTAAPRTFDAGTVISANSSNIKFSLDTQVTVASRSATLEGITYGKTDVAVTAQIIGTESNISAGQDFKVADFDSSLFSAHNDQVFSGGTSRESTVVSEEDLKKLEKALTDDLFNKAKSEFSSKLSSQQKLLDEAVFKTVVSKSFDKKAGDESAVVALNLELKMRATTYNEDDLKKVLLGYIKTSIPSDFELVESQANTTATISKVAENGDLIFNGKLEANLIPKLNIKEIQENLAGKKPQTVEAYLTGLPEIIGSQISLKPPLPGPLAVLPRVASRIEIIVTPR